MPTYVFRCTQCGEYETYLSDPVQFHVCPRCQQMSRRRFTPPNTYVDPFDSHYNPTVNQVITSKSQFKSELSRASDLASEKTGIAHNYQPVDTRDREALGVTSPEPES